MDYEEAREVLQKCLNEMSLEELYENVLIPALGLAEQDRHQNLLQDENERFISQSTRELIDELWEPRNGENTSESEGVRAETTLRAVAPDSTRSLNILCVPARDEADEIVGTMLAQLLQRAGHQAECLEVGSAEHMLAQIPKAETGHRVYFGFTSFRDTSGSRTVRQNARAESESENNCRLVAFFWRLDETRPTPCAERRFARIHDSG